MELQYAQPPSHEDILRVIRRNLNTEPSCEKVSCIEMSFLLQMVDLERRNMVFSNLTKCTGVTEGKFALLMVLHDAGMPMPVGELAARLRVSTPTASTMLQRMLASPEKLIVKTPSATDARSTLIALTDAGRKYLTDLLPGHFERVEAFASVLSPKERLELIGLCVSSSSGDKKQSRRCSAAPAFFEPCLI